jgi:hypothetical protein
MQNNNTTSLTIARSNRPWSRRSLIATIVAVPALVALTACAGAAPTPPSQPTVQAAATQVVAAASPAAATAQAAASPALATAQAGASPAIATMQVIASPAAAAGASVVGTAVSGLAPMASPSPSPSPAAQGAGALRIADASLGDATRWLSIENNSREAIPMAGWKLQIGEATAELPADATVQPGSALTLHAGNGLSSEDELYLGNAGDALAAAAQPGTPVMLIDANGTVHARTTVPRI